MSDFTRILSQIESGDPAAAGQLLPLVYDELRKLAAARLAHEKPGQTLSATALVHEAYLRLVGGRQERSEVRGRRSEDGGQRSDEDKQLDDLRDHRSAAVPATSDLRPPIPDPRSPTSDLRPPISDACPPSPAFDSRGHFFAAAAEAMRRILVESARRKNRLKHGGNLDRVDVELADLPTRMGADDLIALDEALQRLQQQDPVKARLVTLRFFAGLTIEQASEVLGISRVTAFRYWTFARAWLHQEIRGEPPRPAESG